MLMDLRERERKRGREGWTHTHTEKRTLMWERTRECQWVAFHTPDRDLTTSFWYVGGCSNQGATWAGIDVFYVGEHFTWAGRMYISLWVGGRMYKGIRSAWLTVLLCSPMGGLRSPFPGRGGPSFFPSFISAACAQTLCSAPTLKMMRFLRLDPWLSWPLSCFSLFLIILSCLKFINLPWLPLDQC